MITYSRLRLILLDWSTQDKDSQEVHKPLTLHKNGTDNIVSQILIHKADSWNVGPNKPVKGPAEVLLLK